MNKYRESRRIARLNWAHSEHGKKWSKDYMREYRKRPEVKARAHEYYLRKITKEAEAQKTRNWGGARTESEVIKTLHEEWATKNGYRENQETRNEDLHAENSMRFVNYENG